MRERSAGEPQVPDEGGHPTVRLHADLHGPGERVVVAGAAVVVAAFFAPPQPARIAAATNRRAARVIAAKRSRDRLKTA